MIFHRFLLLVLQQALFSIFLFPNLSHYDQYPPHLSFCRTKLNFPHPENESYPLWFDLKMNKCNFVLTSILFFFMRNNGESGIKYIKVINTIDNMIENLGIAWKSKKFPIQNAIKLPNISVKTTDDIKVPRILLKEMLEFEYDSKFRTIEIKITVHLQFHPLLKEWSCNQFPQWHLQWIAMHTSNKHFEQTKRAANLPSKL